MYQKPRQYGTPKEAIARLITQAGGVERVMVDLTVGKTQVYAWTDPQSDSEIWFSRAAALTRPGINAAAEYLAFRAGGLFLPLPEGDASLAAGVAKSARSFGFFIGDVVEALRDGKLTQQERCEALRLLDDLLRELAPLRAALLAGDGEAP